ITAGALPTGVTLNGATGALSGTPTASGSFTITAQVTDSESPAVSKSASFTFSIAAGTVTITTPSLPNGQVGVAYAATLAATGGITPYTWSVTSGALPAGVTLNGATGALSGTPTASGSFTITAQVSDSESPVVSKSASFAFSIAVGTISVSTASLPNGQVGTPYSATLA